VVEIEGTALTAALAGAFPLVSSAVTADYPAAGEVERWVALHICVTAQTLRRGLAAAAADVAVESWTVSGVVGGDHG
jgi:hypothetical protein